MSENAIANMSRDEPPNVVFADAIVGIEVFCRQLDIATSNQDVEAVEHIARNAVQVWLGARTVCGELMEIEHSRGCGITAYSNAVRAELDTSYTNLLGRFASASSSIRIPHLCNVLHTLRQRLICAAAEPLSKLEKA